MSDIGENILVGDCIAKLSQLEDWFLSQAGQSSEELEGCLFSRLLLCLVSDMRVMTDRSHGEHVLLIFVWSYS